MNALFSSGWMSVAVPAATSFFCFASVIGIINVVMYNKGAKVNLAWGLVAAGLFAFAVADGDRVFAALGLPNMSDLRGAVRLSGALLIFGGVLYGRDIFKRLVK